MKRLLLVVGLFILFASEIFGIYFIMPFPGSQVSNTISFAYWLNNNIFWLQIFGLLLIAYPLFKIYKNKAKGLKITMSVLLLIYCVIFYLFNFRFKADKMFYQPSNKSLVALSDNQVDLNKIIIGINLNGVAKAYPIGIIGYHHQVQDTLDKIPVMITYCTVCRTGRVFSPFVNNKKENFRLVGMDHFNAMFEDETTKSWWQQATGKAITGPLKGYSLKEIPSRQMSLKAWLSLYPTSTILQPDTLYSKQYKDLADYDKGTIKGSLEKRDTLSWKFKSWIVGINETYFSKAYDWIELVKKHFIQDSVSSIPILITLEKDSTSFHALNRLTPYGILYFSKLKDHDTLVDSKSNCYWTMNGLCTTGTEKGTQLEIIQAYQEFWHSWKNFHPNTLQFPSK